MAATQQTIDTLEEATGKYKYGFVTDIDSDKAPKGLNEEIIRLISEKKEENASQKLSESDINLIKKMINKLSTKEITNLISSNRNISKKEIYNFCLKIKNEI